MTDPPALIARVEAGSGPLDDETLARSLCTLQGVEYGGHGIGCGDDGGDGFEVWDASENRVETFARGGYRDLCPDVSVDAVIALARERHPKCRLMVESSHDGSGWAMFCKEPGAPRDMTDAPTPARALLAALLRAEMEKQP